MVKLQLLLEKIVSLEKADKGNIQIYDTGEGGLKIVAHYGFEEEFLKHFHLVKPFDPTTCGRAFGIGNTVLINDIETDLSFKSNREAARKAGYRSVKSVPVFGKMDKCIGIVSTHFQQAKWEWETRGLINVLPQIALELDALQENVK